MWEKSRFEEHVLDQLSPIEIARVKTAQSLALVMLRTWIDSKQEH